MIVTKVRIQHVAVKNMMKDNNRIPDLYYGEFYDEKKEESEYYQQVMDEHIKNNEITL